MKTEKILDSGFVVIQIGGTAAHTLKYNGNDGERRKEQVTAWLFMTSDAGPSQLDASPHSAHVFKTEDEAKKRIKKIRVNGQLRVIDLSTANRKTVYHLAYGDVDALEVPIGVCAWSSNIYPSEKTALQFRLILQKIEVTKLERRLSEAKERLAKYEAEAERQTKGEVK